MARLTPEELAQKWAQRTSGAAQDYAAGVQRVTQSPGQAAAAKRAKWEAGVRESADKWQRRVAAVSLGDWQRKTMEVGAPRFAQGAQANMDKMQAFASEFLPFLDSVTQRVRAMDDTTPEARINRMVAQVRGVAGFRRRGLGG